jgi:hypothetical protein
LPPFGEELLAGRGDVAHEVGGSLGVPVGRIDVDVTHIGRKRGHIRVASASILGAALQHAHRERVPQIVQTRATLRCRCDACAADQPVESLFDRDVTERQTPPVDEYGIGFGTGPTTRQIALQAGCRRVVQRRQAGLPELGLADQQASLVTSATVNLSASEILNPVTESSAIRVA